MKFTLNNYLDAFRVRRERSDTPRSRGGMATYLNGTSRRGLPERGMEAGLLFDHNVCGPRPITNWSRDALDVDTAEDITCAEYEAVEHAGHEMPPGAKPERRMLRFGKTGLELNPAQTGYGYAVFVDAVLRGVGQVIFVNSSYTGLLCLVGILIGSPLQMVLALICTTVGTGVGLLLKADREDVRSGLYGYNACLIAIAAPVFLGSNILVWGLSLLSAGLSAALVRFWLSGRSFGLPALTAPFVFCTWMAVWVIRSLNPAETSGPPIGSLRDVPVEAPGLLEGWTLIEGALTGIGQVFLQSSVESGLIIALAVLVGSRPMFLLACLAGLVSSATALLLDLPVEAIRTGLFGFNAVLVALALGLVYLRPGYGSLAIATFAAMFMPVIQLGCGFFLLQAGLPTMSVPFIATTWVVLVVLRPLARLRAA